MRETSVEMRSSAPCSLFWKDARAGNVRMPSAGGETVARPGFGDAHSEGAFPREPVGEPHLPQVALVARDRPAMAGLTQLPTNQLVKFFGSSHSLVVRSAC
jgi:hypothetical protein